MSYGRQCPECNHMRHYGRVCDSGPVYASRGGGCTCEHGLALKPGAPDLVFVHGVMLCRPGSSVTPDVKLIHGVTLTRPVPSTQDDIDRFIEREETDGTTPHSTDNPADPRGVTKARGWRH